jgi:hypothetical protein
MAPCFTRKGVRIWLARHSSMCSFDPVAAALDSLAEVTVADRLPSHAELVDYGATVVVAQNASVSRFGQSDIDRLGGEGCPPVLWLVGATGDPSPGVISVVKPTRWPIPLDDLARFIDQLGPIAAR